MRNYRRGFTLTEVLLVSAMLALISLAVFNAFSNGFKLWARGERVMAEGDTALAAGEAGGTIDGVAWRTPAAWMATVREGKVAEWRVFADNKPVYEILARRQP